jgi:hypothetical protein
MTETKQTEPELTTAPPAEKLTKLVEAPKRSRLVRVRAEREVFYKNAKHPEGHIYQAGEELEVDEETAKQWTTPIAAPPSHTGMRESHEVKPTSIVRASRLN